MAKARLYAFNGTEPKNAVRGQAAVVLAELKRDTTPRLATDIAETVASSGELKTRQDILRVVLYYIIIFKNRGMVSATEQAPANVEVLEHDDELETADEVENDEEFVDV
jgi:hypothetical protein